jgi:hypothetical protein
MELRRLGNCLPELLLNKNVTRQRKGHLLAWLGPIPLLPWGPACTQSPGFHGYEGSRKDTGKVRAKVKQRERAFEFEFKFVRRKTIFFVEDTEKSSGRDETNEESTIKREIEQRGGRRAYRENGQSFKEGEDGKKSNDDI